MATPTEKPSDVIIRHTAGLEADVAIETHGALGENEEALAGVEARGYWELIWRRFRHDRLAVASGVFLIFLILAAYIGAPIVESLLGHGPNAINPLAVDYANSKPAGPWSHVPVYPPKAGQTTLYVLGADGYLFATPENLAAVSGLMKDFFDRTYYAALDRINGRPYATLICAGSDGANAARQIARIATGWRLRAIAEPLIVCTHAQAPEAILAPKHIECTELDRCKDMGAAMAAGLAAGIF